MPSSYLPPELLNLIFTHLATGPPPPRHPEIDFLCCSLVSRAWFDSAVPFYERAKRDAEFARTPHLCTVHQYTDNELRCFIIALGEARKNCVPIGMAVKEVVVIGRELLALGEDPLWNAPGEVWNPALINAAGRLIHSLIPQDSQPGSDDSFCLTLRLNRTNYWFHLRPLRDMLTCLAPWTEGLTNLSIHDYQEPPTRIDIRASGPRPSTLRGALDLLTDTLFGSSPPQAAPVLAPEPDPLSALLRSCSATLTQLSLQNTHVTASMARTLRSCVQIQIIRMLRPHFHLSPADFADMLACWKGLRILSVRNPHPSTGNTLVVISKANELGSKPGLPVVYINGWNAYQGNGQGG